MSKTVFLAGGSGVVGAKLIPLLIEDAAQAASLAVRKGLGIYNIAEEDGPYDVGKATADLHFQPRQHDS